MDFFDFAGDGFFDLFGGGSIEGGGIFDCLSEGWSSLFEGGAERAAFEDIFAAGLRGGAATEGGFASVFRLLGTSADTYIDYMLLRDLGRRNGHHGFGDAASEEGWWRQAKQGGQISPEIEAARDVVKSHGFILSQLREHKDVKGISKILAEYETLGVALPDKTILTQAYRKLAGQLHTDTNTVDKTLMTQLNTARDTLKSEEKCSEYQKILAEDPSVIEDLMGKLGETNWRNVYEGAEESARLRLEDLSKKPEIMGKFEALSDAKKGGLIFAGIAGVGLLAYGGAKYMEQRQQNKLSQQKDAQASWQEKIEASGNKTTNTGLESQQR